MPDNPTLAINIREILSFFDEKPSWSSRHATGIVAMLGEDLSAACLQHCLRANGATYVNVRSETVGTGRTKGPRLDRWIEADLAGGRRILFQTEIKSWSAHAIGGKTIAVDASPKELNDYKRERWQQVWDARRRTIVRANVAKVLVHMSTDQFDTDGRDILPLAIFWYPVGTGSKYRKNQSLGGHLFNIDQPTCDFPFDVPSSWPDQRGFPELWVFSVSSYLRSITEDQIELTMPIAAGRMHALNRIAASAVT